MQLLERTPFGVEVNLSEFIAIWDAERLFFKSISMLHNIETPFGLLVDCSSLEYIADDAIEILMNAQKYYVEHGLERSAIVYSNPSIIPEYKKISKASGLFVSERYILNDREAAINWIVDGKEPQRTDDQMEDRMYRASINTSNHIFIRNGNGWTLKMSLSDTVDANSLRGALIAMNLEIENVTRKYKLESIKLRDCEASCRCACNQEEVCNA